MVSLFHIHVPTLLMLPCSISHIPIMLISLNFSPLPANSPITFLMAEVGYSERTFKHHPETRHGTGNKRGMKAWQVPGMQNKVWLHTGESMLHSSARAWLLSLPLRHTRKQTTYRVATRRAETYGPFVQQDPTHFSGVVLWCTTDSQKWDSSQLGQQLKCREHTSS